MKDIKIIGLLLLLSVSACEKFFETDPGGVIPEEKFYQNINDFQLALTSAYSVLKTEQFQKCLVLLGDCMSDDFAYGYSANPGVFGEDGFKLVRYNITPENYWVERWYFLNYQGIYRANQLLKHIEDSVHIYSTIRDDQDVWWWQHIYGQALFLRAYYYFNLVKAYGGVSIVPESYELEHMSFPRSSLEECYTYIEKDLRTAALLLKGDLENSPDHIGEATKYAALALLMKTFIYQAEPGIPSSHWVKAREIGDVLFKGEFISYNELLIPEKFYPGMSWEQLWDKFKFSSRLEMPVPVGDEIINEVNLVNNRGFYNWENLLRIQFQNAKDNREVIWALPCMIGNTLNPEDYSLSNYIDRLYGINYKFACYPVFPTESLAREFDYERGDPRRFYGMYSHNMSHNAEPLKEIKIGGVATENYLIFIKRWLIPGVEQNSGDEATERNITLMRYADYVLLYAEALNETGSSGDAIDILNSRRRNLFETMGKGSGDFNLSFPYAPYETVRDRIWHERRMDLAGEFERYWDLLRQGRAGDIMNGSEGVIDQLAIAKKDITFIKGVHELLPIPLKEIELSHGIVQQNPGY